MLDVKLDTHYKLTGDSMNYILEKRSKTKNKEGEYTWTGIKFAGTISHILKSYKELKIRTSNCKTIDEILEVSKEIDEKIENILNVTE